MPVAVQREMGFALYQAQEGKRPHNIKILKGIDSRVVEVISNYNKNTYRAVYAMKLNDYIYVLHVFQKKSKQGIKTTKQDIDLIKQRIADIKHNRLSYREQS